MYHSITFYPYGKAIASGNGKNTWDDWHLIPAVRPYAEPPGVKNEYVDTSSNFYSNSVFRLTDNRDTTYTLGKRVGQIEFYVMSDYYMNYNEGTATIDNPSSWIGWYSGILNFLQGKKIKMVFEDDPGYFYQGIVNVQSYNPQKQSTITISYEVDPYKYSIYATDEEDWMWDPFDFVDGTVTTLENFVSVPLNNPAVGGTAQYMVLVPTSDVKVIPIITVEVVSYDDTTGPSLRIDKGTLNANNVLVANGSASLTPSNFAGLTNSSKTFRFASLGMSGDENAISFTIYGVMSLLITVSFRNGKL